MIDKSTGNFFFEIIKPLECNRNRRTYNDCKPLLYDPMVSYSPLLMLQEPMYIMKYDPYRSLHPHFKIPEVMYNYNIFTINSYILECERIINDICNRSILYNR